MGDIYVDGSVSNYGYCYCIFEGNARKYFSFIEDKKPTSRFLEFSVVLYALERCIPDSIINSDCQEIYWRVKNNYLPEDKQIGEILLKIMDLLKEKNCKIRWIKRNRNLAGVYLQKRIAKLKNYSNSTTNTKRRLSGRERYLLRKKR